MGHKLFSPKYWFFDFVKVTAVISLGEMFFSSISQAMRLTSVPVLPVPGPAITSMVLSSARMASSCSGFGRKPLSIAVSFSI